jgi:hypothetical protein
MMLHRRHPIGYRHTCTEDEWLEDLEAGRTPRAAPLGCSPFGNDLSGFDVDVKESLRRWDARRRGQELGMHCIIYRAWVAELAAWLDGRLVLEVMAGRGWLVQALREHGAQVIATDDFSWREREKWEAPLVSVLPMDAVDAATKYTEAEVLLCAWPYMDDTLAKACAAWGSARPIVYVGEGSGGCCASDAFFQGFVDDKDGPVIELLTWWGIHDGVYTGRWRKTTYHMKQPTTGVG